jgi:hypothetical protein
MKARQQNSIPVFEVEGDEYVASFEAYRGYVKGFGRILGAASGTTLHES